jgi:hypothetical protein
VKSLMRVDTDGNTGKYKLHVSVHESRRVYIVPGKVIVPFLTKRCKSSIKHTMTKKHISYAYTSNVCEHAYFIHR